VRVAVQLAELDYTVIGTQYVTPLVKISIRATRVDESALPRLAGD
jgi:hypothetical protein